MNKTICDIPTCKVSRAFLGTEKIPDKVIFTPISGIYNEIKGRYNAKERHECWWDNFTYETKNKQEVIVVETHQGNTIVDPILTMNENCNHLMFLGFCGGLQPDMKIGDVTIATQSYFENQYVIYKPKTDFSKVISMFPNSISGTNLTVESVLRETKALKSKKPGYLKEGTVSIDQETAYLYKESTSAVASVMVVTDLPLTRTVFELSDEENKQIRNGVKKLTDGIIDLTELI
jgi:purine-nucleoside phosphorylase